MTLLSLNEITWTVSVVSNILNCWSQALQDDSTDKSIQITFLNTTFNSNSCNDTCAVCSIENTYNQNFSNSTMSATVNSTFSFVYQSTNFPSVQSPLLCFVSRNCEIGNIILNNNGIPTYYLCPNQTY